MTIGRWDGIYDLVGDLLRDVSLRVLAACKIEMSGWRVTRRGIG